MKSDIFIDTSGFYSLLVKNDGKHRSAAKILAGARSGVYSFVTSDYVIDETVTLMKARGFRHIIPDFLRLVNSSNVCRIEWTDSERFEAASKFCTKHLDQEYSFTDCLIMSVMKELGLKKILTKDEHFKIAGFDAMLAEK